MKTENRTAMDLKPYGYEPMIKAEGDLLSRRCSWSDYLWSINHSSILSRLIQEAGRYCERFASDLFIDWSAVEDILKSEEQVIEEASYHYFFGFRESGVDGETYINYKLQSDQFHHEYRSIWRLDIDINSEGNKLTMKLYRVD